MNETLRLKSAVSWLLPIAVIVLTLPLIMSRGCEPPCDDKIAWKLDSKYVDPKATPPGEKQIVTVEQLFSQSNIRRLGFSQDASQGEKFDGTVCLGKAKNIQNNKDALNDVERAIAKLNNDRPVHAMLLIDDKNFGSESLEQKALVATLKVTWDAGRVKEGQELPKEKLGAFEKAVGGFLQTYNDVTFEQLSAAGALALRDKDCYDVVLQDLLKAEVWWSQQDQVIWEPGTPVFGFKPEDKARAEANATSFQSTGDIKVFPSTAIDPYRSSYTKWYWALERFRRGRENEQWEQIFKDLADLSASYRNGSGRFAGYRNDGSVLTLAMYTMVILRLEAPEGTPLFNELDKNFKTIAANLLVRMRSIEGANPETGQLATDHAYGWYQSKNDRSNYDLAGGRMLYFALGALVAETDGNRDAATRLLEQGVRVREQFALNAPKVGDYYLSCYLLRAATCNSRLCLRLKKDNWSEDWFNFAKSIVLTPPAKGADRGSQHSNYYYFLGRIGFYNSMTDAQGEFAKRFRTKNE